MGVRNNVQLLNHCLLDARITMANRRDSSTTSRVNYLLSILENDVYSRSLFDDRLSRMGGALIEM